MKNIYLVQVVDSYGPNKFLPLAIAYQWLYGRNNHWQLKDVLIEKIPPKQYVSSMQDPKMVAMSSYIWNWEYNKTLATEIKKKWPKCIIVVGGPQVDKNNKNFFLDYPMFDLAVHGEGEHAFKEILKRENNFDGIDHVQTRSFMPKSVSRKTDLLDIPSPILTGFYEPIMKKYPADTMWQVTFETLRGCPYHCSFCDIGDSYWNKLTLFDIERVKKEIEWMGKNKIEYVSVCDSNWGLLERDVNITEHVIKTKKKYGYPKWWDATWAKNNVERNFEIAMLNKTSGANIFKGVTFAMQSFNDNTLKASERFNIKENQVNHFLKRYQEESIPTYSELIWPMPEETYDSLKQGVQKLIDLGQDSFLMIHPLVITYNATMGNKSYQKKYDITTKKVPLDTYYLSANDLENYIVEYTDAVYSTRTANFETVLRGHMFSWVSILMYYYGWGHYLAKYLRHHGIKETDFFERLLVWIENNPDTLLYREYKQTKDHIVNTFHNEQFWGRKVRGSEDIYWEYKGASSIVLHDNIAKLEKELTNFAIECTNIREELVKEAVKLNLLMCRIKDLQYPFRTTTNSCVAQDMLGINSDTLIIDHHDKVEPDHLWYNKAYHWDRKSKYWACTASNGKNMRR